jgi:uncharacterized membrane protein
LSSPELVHPSLREYERLRARVLNYYFTVVVISFIAIGILVAYCISLGTLVGPGVEESLGLALALLFLFTALLVHTVDRAYREWPLGRLVAPDRPSVITDWDTARLLRILVLVAAALLIAWIIAGLLTS